MCCKMGLLSNFKFLILIHSNRFDSYIKWIQIHLIHLKVQEVEMLQLLIENKVKVLNHLISSVVNF